jgi:hypothetical protein
LFKSETIDDKQQSRSCGATSSASWDFSSETPQRTLYAMKIENIFFDIDNTLFDYQAFEGKALWHFLKDLPTFRIAKDLAAIATLATEPLNNLLNPDIFHGSFLDAQYYRSSLYKDVLPVFNFLRKKVRIGIWSQARYKTQMIKLSNCGLLPFIDPKLIFISSQKTEFVNQQFKNNSLFIEDRPDVARRMRTRQFNILIIDRTRKIKENKEIAIIHSLAEIQDFFS